MFSDKPFLALFFFTAIPAALLFVLQLGPWALSSKFRAFIRNHRTYRILLLIWGTYSLLGVIVFLPILLNWWPPLFIERPRQEAKIEERLHAAGGWAALQKDCDALVAQHQKEGGFVWFMGDANTLPPSIAALKPMEVRFYSPAMVSDDDPKIPIVHIRVFGRNRTGGHKEPFLGIDVISGTDLTGYPPNLTPKWGPRTYKKVTETIYKTHY